MVRGLETLHRGGSPLEFSLSFALPLWCALDSSEIRTNSLVWSASNTIAQVSLNTLSDNLVINGKGS